ncbi:MAG: multidrug effflux MFS transporter [Propionicimonas sp.]|uniref:multidrug effflux MFS transporter n=1 Tax=Propionicimonas sp. TaxID=1955623 RepID=UPI003D10FB71
MADAVDARPEPSRRIVPITAGLLAALAVQNAVPPFATDMYSPAFPDVATDLGASAALVGLTLTTFFLGFGAGQLVGGPLSDQRGRRVPMLVGGVICTLGGIACALAPSVGVLIAARLLQGIGGGVASVSGRAVLIDVAKGDTLARWMSVMVAIGGLAPMLAPVLGAGVLLVGTWRTVFWVLAGFGVVMVLTASLFVPETLPPEARHAGGLRHSVAGIGEVLRIRSFLGFMLTAALGTFSMLGYIAGSSFVLQEIKGLSAMQYALFFSGNALLNILLSLVNARIVGRFRPENLMLGGMVSSATGVLVLGIGVFFFGTPLVTTLVGFVLLVGSQAFIMGNAGALAVSRTLHLAGAASAVQGVANSVAMAIGAPLASSGGGTTAVPMVLMMAFGVVASFSCYFGLARPALRPGTVSQG